MGASHDAKRASGNWNWLRDWWGRYREAAAASPSGEALLRKRLYDAHAERTKRKRWAKEVADELDYFADAAAPPKRACADLDPPTQFLGKPLWYEPPETFEVVDGDGELVRKVVRPPSLVRPYLNADVVVEFLPFDPPR